MLGLCCCMDFFLSCGKQGLLSTCSALVCHCRGFSCYGAWALGIVGFSSCGFWALEHRLNIVAHRLTCSMTCGILPYQGSNPCLLHWQVDSLPLSHQRSPSSKVSKARKMSNRCLIKLTSIIISPVKSVFI